MVFVTLTEDGALRGCMGTFEPVRKVVWGPDAGPAKQAAEAEDIAKQHDNTLRALRDGLPLVLPSWSLPVFFGAHLDEKMKGETKTEKKKEVKTDRQASPTPASNR